MVSSSGAEEQAYQTNGEKKELLLEHRVVDKKSRGSMLFVKASDRMTRKRQRGSKWNGKYKQQPRKTCTIRMTPLLLDAVTSQSQTHTLEGQARRVYTRKIMLLMIS